MSIKTNKPSNVIDREYGRRMYMSKKPYAEQIRIPTQAASDNAIDTKHSEFKKPYLSDTYEEMEYFADAPVGYSLNPTGPFNIDTPWMGTPVPDFVEMYDPWRILFYCFPDLCWCEGEKRCGASNCTQEVVNVEFVLPKPGWELTWTKTQICITAPEDAYGSVNIDITMKAPVPYTDDARSLWKQTYKVVYGRHGFISISECRASECCSGTVTAWDYVNSPATIGQSTNATVYVTGSGTDLEWSVSGSGFFFDVGLSQTTITTGASTKLYTNAAACGQAKITVTDCANNVVTGYIRCTVGVWTSFNLHDYTTSDCDAQLVCGGTSYYYTDPGHRVVCGGDQRMIRINVPEGCDSSNGFNREEITATAPDGVTISLDAGEAYDKEGRLASVCFSNTQVGGTRLIAVDCNEQYFECA